MNHFVVQSDVGHLTDVFTSAHNPVYTEENLEDGAILSDAFETWYRSLPFLSPIEDSAILSDVFSPRPKRRYVRGIESGIGLTDRLELRKTSHYSRDLEDGLALIDAFGARNTVRTFAALEDAVGLGDEFEFSKEDIAVLCDSLNLGHTGRPLLFVEDSAILEDAFVVKFALFVVGGSGSGIYEPGSRVPIVVDTAREERFLFWGGENRFVDEYCEKSTFVRMPNETVRIEAIKGDISLQDIQALGGRVTAANLDIVMEQGATFERNLYYKDSNGNPVDVTSYTAAMHVRKHKGSGVALLTLTSSAGYIVLSGEAGHIEIHIPANEMDDLDFVWAYYDLELYPEGDTSQAFRLLEGRISLSKEVTR